MEILLDVISVKTREDYTLDLTFENGEKRIFDMKPFLIKNLLSSCSTLRYFLKRLSNTALWFGRVISILHRRHCGPDLCRPHMVYPNQSLNPPSGLAPHWPITIEEVTMKPIQANVWQLATACLTFWIATCSTTVHSADLPPSASAVFQLAQHGRRYTDVEKLHPQVIPTSDGQSFLVVWKPRDSEPSHWIFRCMGARASLPTISLFGMRI